MWWFTHFDPVNMHQIYQAEYEHDSIHMENIISKHIK